MVLRREVAVDRRERDVRGRGDVAHLHRVVAALGSELEGRVDDAAPALELLVARTRRRRTPRSPAARSPCGSPFALPSTSARGTAALLSTRGSAGSPSTRSPITLRWISSLPPAMRMAGAPRNDELPRTVRGASVVDQHPGRALDRQRELGVALQVPTRRPASRPTPPGREAVLALVSVRTRRFVIPRRAPLA